MNILQQQDALKGLSDQQLAMEMQQPTGAAPPYLVLTELQRRKEMRSKVQQQAPQTSMAEEAVAGITALPVAEGMEPIAERAQAPQGMRAGGVVRMAAGGSISALGNLSDDDIERYLAAYNSNGVDRETVPFAYEALEREREWRRRNPATVSRPSPPPAAAPVAPTVAPTDAGTPPAPQDNTPLPLPPPPAPPMPSYDIAARMVQAEAGGEGPLGMAAVANVIRNRARRLGISPDDVVRQRGQFQPWGDNPQGITSMRPEQYATARAIMERVMSGETEDPTGGATHFLNPEVTIAQRPDRRLPRWATEQEGQRIGRHVFHRRPQDYPAAESPADPPIEETMVARGGEAARSASSAVATPPAEAPSGIASTGVRNPAEPDEPEATPAGPDRFAALREQIAASRGESAAARREAQNMALIEAGLRIMGSQSPHFATAIGDAAPAVQGYARQVGDIRRGDRDAMAMQLAIGNAEENAQYRRDMAVARRDDVRRAERRDRDQLDYQNRSLEQRQAEGEANRTVQRELGEGRVEARAAQTLRDNLARRLEAITTQEERAIAALGREIISDTEKARREREIRDRFRQERERLYGQYGTEPPQPTTPPAATGGPPPGAVIHQLIPSSR